MALSFDAVLQTVLRTCEARPDFANVARATIVRDVRGRVRLALEVRRETTLDEAAPTADLAAALGDWFAPPILGENLAADLKRIRSLIFERHEPWADAWYEEASGAIAVVDSSRWYRLERRLSKLEWLAGEKARLPWPLREGMPAVVTSRYVFSVV